MGREGPVRLVPVVRLDIYRQVIINQINSPQSQIHLCNLQSYALISLT